ncbi:transposable element Tcb2 transposase [Trichonephila clavipes]|nr:transposable element Tcb2 transposase [Trichonephila clavipes]
MSNERIQCDYVRRIWSRSARSLSTSTPTMNAQGRRPLSGFISVNKADPFFRLSDNSECDTESKTVSFDNRTKGQSKQCELHVGGLYARKNMALYFVDSKIPCGPKKWAAEHRDLIHNDWSQVLLTNESRFSLECDTKHVLVWSERGTRNNPMFIQKRSHYRRVDLMVWAGIRIGGGTDLYTNRKGNSMAQSYADEILRYHVVSYAPAIDDSFYLIQDNARLHTTNLEKNFLETETTHSVWSGQHALLV